MLRNRIVLGYTVLLWVVSFGVFALEDNADKGMLSLLNLILFIIPLVSVLFATIYTYNSSEFTELLLSQPLRRRTIWLSLYAGLSFSLCLAFLLGVGLPLILFQGAVTTLLMTLCGLMLTLIFISLAMLAAVHTRDKARGIGKAIFLWLYFAILYDAVILFLLFQFAEYPMEKPLMGLSFLNPIDLSRIIILLRLDSSALMGYTGAVFKLLMGNM
ncbi:MAG TPA: ABC transporter permease, partial [Chitinophagaceae bacterium]|nr:ABC transporter permease [Chitinophagaceae bacterium]